LFIRDPKQLTEQKQAELELICQRSETARIMIMLRLRRGREDFQQRGAIKSGVVMCAVSARL
jgi:hypothetical protein